MVGAGAGAEGAVACGVADDVYVSFPSLDSASLTLELGVAECFGGSSLTGSAL